MISGIATGWGFMIANRGHFLAISWISDISSKHTRGGSQYGEY